MASLEMSTYFKIPSVTGAGDLTDSTAKFPYVTRLSYGTYTQWIFIVNLCVKFSWTNVASKYTVSRSVNNDMMTYFHNILPSAQLPYLLKLQPLP